MLLERLDRGLVADRQPELRHEFDKHPSRDADSRAKYRFYGVANSHQPDGEFDRQRRVLRRSEHVVVRHPVTDTVVKSITFYRSGGVRFVYSEHQYFRMLVRTGHVSLLGDTWHAGWTYD